MQIYETFFLGHHCSNICVYGKSCPHENCSTKLHHHCARSTSVGRSQKCPKCKMSWTSSDRDVDDQDDNSETQTDNNSETQTDNDHSDNDVQNVTIINSDGDNSDYQSCSRTATDLPEQLLDSAVTDICQPSTSSGLPRRSGRRR